MNGAQLSTARRRPVGCKANGGMVDRVWVTWDGDPKP